MAIGIISQPEEISFTREPVIVHAQTDIHWKTQAIAASFQMVFNTDTTEDSFILFKPYGSLPEIKFTFKNLSYADCLAAENAAWLPLYMSSGAANGIQWTEMIYNLIISNFNILNYYLVNVSLTNIYFTAIYPGFSGSHEIDISSTTGISLIPIDFPVNNGFLQNYEAVLQVMIDESTIQLSGLPQLTDNFPYTEFLFDIQEILHRHMGIDDELLMEHNYYQCRQINKGYLLWMSEYNEAAQGLGVIYRITEEAHRAIKGGRKIQQYANEITEMKLYYESTDYQYWLTTTWEKRIYSNREKECLQWLYLIAKGKKDIYIYADITYTDLTTDTVVLAQFNPTAQHTYRIRTDYHHPAILGVEAGRAPLKYVVYGKDIDNVDLYEPITYVIEQQYHNALYFFFEASFGGFKTLICNGEQNIGIETDMEEFTALISSLNEDTAARNIHSRLNSYRDTLNAFTGYMRREELLNLMADFLTSEVIYTWDETKTYFETVNIVPGSFSLVRTDDYLYGVEFQVNYAIKNKNHSRRHDRF